MAASEHLHFFLMVVLHGTICMIRFVWLLFVFCMIRIIWTCKIDERWKIVTTFCIKICMIRFLKDRMSSISSDLYEEILKSNKSHTNRIIQIVPCKTSLSSLLLTFSISEFRSSHRKCSIKKAVLKPLIHGQINLIKFIESNKFDNVNTKIWHIFVWSNQFDQILKK